MNWNTYADCWRNQTQTSKNDLNWKESVAEIVLQLVQASGVAFRIDDVYRFESALQNRFPGNRHVREKMRQSLQKLVADGLLLRTERGVYAVDTHSPDLVLTTEAAAGTVASEAIEGKQLPLGNVIVESNLRITTIRLRNTILAIELKRAYEYKCQVCRNAVALRPPHFYAEGHHLRPLGGGHNGPDVPGNILVLCPNHHTMFDSGAAAVEPDSLRLIHWNKDEFAREQKLMVEEWHHLEPAHVAYHYESIFGGA